MGLYAQWNELAKAERSPAQNRAFWNDYLEKEKNVYRYILANNLVRLEGKLDELAGKFGMEPVVFAGFLDGINTSLVNSLDLDSLEKDTAISAEIDFEKLYRNMLEAKADWLYTLKEWDGILDRGKRNEIMKEYRLSKMAVSDKVGRNDPCPCGSGKKYKKCCGR